MSGRAKVVAYLVLLAAGLAVAAVAIPWLESRRTLNLLKEQGATFDVAEDGSVLWMTLPPDRTTDETLLLLQDDSRLIHLSLRDCAITDAGIRNLGTLENLKSLDLSGTSDLHHVLHQFRRSSRIENLELADCRWVDDGEMAAISGFPELTRINLEGTSVTDAVVEDLFRLEQLNDLSLASCPRITDAAAHRLLESPHILHLDLEGASISIACWKQLLDPPSALEVYCPPGGLPEFRPLVAAGGRFSSDPFPYLGSGPITKSDLGFSIKGPVDPVALAALGEFDVLTLVSIVDSPLNDADLRWMAGLPKLKAADLSGTEITDNGLARLADVSTLQTLQLRQTRIRGAGFADFGEMTRLTFVDLTDSDVDDRGAALLARLPAVTQLTLIRTNLTDVGLEALGEAPALESLFVDGTAIDGSGLRGLSRATTLRELSLNCEQLDEASLQRLESFTSLNHLGLNGSGLTPGAVRVLVRLPNLEMLTLSGDVSNEVLRATAEIPALETLNLWSANYNQDALAELRMARPGLRVWE